MDTIGAYAAKTHFSALLERVMSGEEITITKHGVPVAVFKPLLHSGSREPEKVIADLLNFRENNSLDGFLIRDMIEEGRR